MAQKEPKQEPKGLDEVLASIKKDYGDGAVIQGDYVVKGVEGISTGAFTLDVALGIGGIPKGRITEIYGPEASGKTTLCLEIIANVQRAGGKAAFIDAEHALDILYARSGPGVDTTKLLLSQPNSGEEALDICERLAKSGEVSLVVVDSVAALAPQAVIDGEMADHNPGAQARLMSKALCRLKSILNKTNTAVVFTNQLREKIGMMFGNPEVTPGGRALKFYASVRIDIRRLEGVREKGEVSPSGNLVRAKVVKNKVASPFRQAEFEITYGKGINKLGCLIQSAEELNIVKKAGSSFKYDNKTFIGRAKLVEYFEKNPACISLLDTELRDRLKLKQVAVAEEIQAAESAIEIE
jgi:recombination protein RecA